MITRHTVASLQEFEERVKAAFLAGRIRAPVHLSGGNEAQLLQIFEDIKEHDWVLGTHRSHYHALLKGVPEDELFQAIAEGRSIYLSDLPRRFLCSAIVGGVLPLAVGLAMGIRRQRGPERVWCFVGDMAARTGAFWEGTEYARGHNLPVSFVNEDNGLSVDTPTAQTWGHACEPNQWEDYESILYRYVRTVPHVGAGQWVTFS